MIHLHGSFAAPRSFYGLILVDFFLTWICNEHCSFRNSSRGPSCSVEGT